jgi:tetratricopeptide (TPR) repeat protein
MIRKKRKLRPIRASFKGGTTGPALAPSRKLAPWLAIIGVAAALAVGFKYNWWRPADGQATPSLATKGAGAGGLRQNPAAGVPGRDRTKPAPAAPGASNSQPSRPILDVAHSGAISSTTNKTKPGGGASSNALPQTAAEKADELVNEATSMIESGKLAEAVTLFERAAKLSPEDEVIVFNLGFVLSRLGRIKEAEERYGEALKLFPEYADAHINLGNLLMNEKNFAEAMTHFKAALQASPESASAHNSLGTALARQGKPEEALPHFLEAVKLQTNYVEAQYNLGTAYLAAGKVDPAIEEFEKILRAHPDFSPARQALDRAVRQKPPPGPVRLE